MDFFLFDSTFNGLDLLALAGTLGLAFGARAAARRGGASRAADPPVTGPALTRAVRSSYDDLPYRNGRGWGPRRAA